MGESPAFTVEGLSASYFEIGGEKKFSQHLVETVLRSKMMNSIINIWADVI